MYVKRYVNILLCSKGMRGKRRISDERGMVLVVGLLLIVVLSLLGTTAVIVSTTDLKISSNYKTSNQAFYAAEAGVEETRARLKGSLPDTVIIKDPNYPDSKWSAYILTPGLSSYDDPDYNAYNTANYKNYIPSTTSQTSTVVQSNTLQTGTPILPYRVKVKHKTEYDAELKGHTPSNPHYSDLDGSTAGGHTLASPGNIVYYGYRDSSSVNPEYFTSTGTPSKNLARPLEIIRAYGSAGNASARIVEVEVRRPIGISVPGALYGNMIGGGGTVAVDGRDNCGASDDITALAYVTGQTLWPSGSVSCLPAGMETAQVPQIPIAQRVSALQLAATDILTADGTNLLIGSPSDYRIVYSDATVLTPDQELDLQNLTGYGILVVKGDVYFSGNLNWHGLIIASGNTSFYGGGANEKNVYGAVLSNTTATLQGKVNITYDSCEINKANETMTPVVLIWKEKTG